MVVGEGSFCYFLNWNKIVLEKWLPKNMIIGAAGSCFIFFKACFLHLLRNLSVHSYYPPLTTGTTVFARCLSVASFLLKCVVKWRWEWLFRCQLPVLTKAWDLHAFSHDSPHLQPPLPNQPLLRQPISCSELNHDLHWGLIFIIL